MLILVGWVRPLDSNFANNLEIFNEWITLMTLYMLMCFSDFVGEPEARSTCGYWFIGTVCLYALVHFYFLFKDVFVKLYNLIRGCYYKRRNKKLLLKRQNYLQRSSVLSLDGPSGGIELKG